MIGALIAGRLIGKPTARVARNGNEYATPWLRVAGADGEAVVVSLISFSVPACRALLALDDGEAVAMAGTAAPRLHARDGKPMPAPDITVQQVLIAYAEVRRQKCEQ